MLERSFQLNDISCIKKNYERTFQHQTFQHQTFQLYYPSNYIHPLQSPIDFVNHYKTNLSKADIQLTFNIELVVMEVTNIKNCEAKRKVYCTMELEGGEKLQTEPVPSNRAMWETQADFQSNQVRPVMKVKLFQK